MPTTRNRAGRGPGSRRLVLALAIAQALLLSACTDETLTDVHADAGPSDDAGADAGSSGTAVLHADWSETLGTLDDRLFGATAAPHPDAAGYDAAERAGFRLIPSGFNAAIPSDPSVPSQYDFSELDDQVGKALAAGAETMIVFAPATAPDDLDAYGTFAANVARHLTQGWADGKLWPVKLYRFGNEPDDQSAYWHGTQQEFFDTYAAWARALKEVDPTFTLEAPGVANARNGKDLDELHPWIPAFLDYCEENDVPLDYLSFHIYSLFLPAYYQDARLVKEAIDQRPGLSPVFGAPRLANDEWNMALGDMWSGRDAEFFHTEWPAPTLIGGLINMIDGGLSLSIPMFGTFNGGQDGCHDFPLVECDGTPKASYHAFHGFNQLAGLTRVALSGYDRMNLTALAGRSDDAILVAIANQDIRAFVEKFEPADSPSRQVIDDLAKEYGDAVYDRVRIDVANLPWPRVRVERTVVDADHGLERVDARDLAADEAYEAEITRPSVQFLRFTAGQ